MHRSSSYYLSSSSASSLAAAGAGPGGAAGVDVDQLPTYDQQSDAAKKEALDASRANLAHALVHLVPVVVLLCGLVLWLLSAITVPPIDGCHNDSTKGRLVPLESSTHGWNRSGAMAKTEDPDQIYKVSHGLMMSKQDGDKAGKGVKKDGLKK